MACCAVFGALGASSYGRLTSDLLLATRIASLVSCQQGTEVIECSILLARRTTGRSSSPAFDRLQRLVRDSMTCLPLKASWTGKVKQKHRDIKSGHRKRYILDLCLQARLEIKITSCFLSGGCWRPSPAFADTAASGWCGGFGGVATRGNSKGKQTLWT